jgi:hypothetical protein
VVPVVIDARQDIRDLSSGDARDRGRSDGQARFGGIAALMLPIGTAFLSTIRRDSTASRWAIVVAKL